ncbi:Sister chromatid cohesion protein dcc1 [Schizosaccharomyces pombe]
MEANEERCILLKYPHPSSDISSEYLLLELDDDLLKTLEENPEEEIVFKSDFDKKASVLCTSDKTYAVRQVVQSNSYLLFDELSPTDWVLNDTCYSFLEVERIYGFIFSDDKISYWDEDSVELKPISLTKDQFIRSVPASRNEVDSFLQKNFFMVKNEFLYRLSPSYICSIIDWIFVIAQQLHIDFASFEFKIFKKPAMDDEFDWDSVICVLESISSPIKDNVLPKKFNIDLELTTFWYGRFLLEGINSISSDEFIQLWDNRLPYPCKGLPSLNLLKGYYFHDTPNTIQYLSGDQLPREPSRRFQSLFQLKSKWLYEELWSFVKDLALSKSRVEALILKYGRKQTSRDGVYINSRGTW